MATSYSNRLGTAPEEGVKAPCVVAAVSNITLSGEQVIGSVSVIAGKRVLVMGQTNPADNGIYDSNASAWSRATDWNEGQDIVNGQMVIVPNAIYQASFVGDMVVGTTEVSFINVLSANNTTIVESFTATAGQTIFTLTTSTYTPAANNIDVYINGVRQSNQSYVETSSTVITFVEGLYAGDLVDLVVNQRSVGVDIILSSNVTHTRDTDSGGATVSLAAELHRTTTGNVTVYELGTTAAASSHAGIITGHIIRTNYFDSARTSGSGAEHSFTGVTTLGKAGNWPDADGYFYDADGKQFAVVGDVVSPLWFGANGGADDGAAIAAAIASSASTIDYGDTAYTVTGSITLTSNKRHIAGSASITMNGTTPSIFNGSTLENIVFDGLTFIGGTELSTIYNGSCISIQAGAVNIKVQNCLFTFFKGAGVNLENATRCNIINNKFTDSRTVAGAEFSTGSHDIVLWGSSISNRVSGNSCSSGGMHAIGIQTLDFKVNMLGNTVVDNNINGYEGYGIYLYISNKGTDVSRKNIVSNNVVSDIRGSMLNSSNPTPLIYGTGIYIQGADGTVVNGNSVYLTNQLTASETLAPGGIGCANSKGVVITNNYIKDCAKRGIMMKDGAALGDDVFSVIANNIIDGSGDDGIRLTDTAQCIISGNSISDSGLRGIAMNASALAGIDQVTIANNMVQNSGSQNYTLNDLRYSTVIGNTSIGATTWGMVVGVNTDVDVLGNYVTGSGNYGFRISGANTGLRLKNNRSNSNAGVGYRLDTSCDFDSSNLGTTSGAFGRMRIAADLDTTPTVLNTYVLRTANTGATIISDFDDGYDGQEVTVIINDNNTTIDFTSTNLKGNGNSNWSPVQTDSMRCVKTGTIWYCQVG